jgi:hypothetical protein
LVFEVHGAGGGSDKALSGLKDYFHASAFQTLRDYRPWNAVSFANGDNFFTCQHQTSS